MQTRIIPDLGWPPAGPVEHKEKPKPKRKRAKSTAPKPETVPLKIGSDPLPPPRSIHFKGMYDDQFSQLVVGSSIACETKDVAKVVIALRSWIRRDQRAGVVATAVAKYETDDHPYDGTGRVWLLKEGSK